MCLGNAVLHFHGEHSRRERFLHDCNNMGKLNLCLAGAAGMSYRFPAVHSGYMAYMAHQCQALIPVQSQPAQVEEHAFAGSRAHAGLIEVLYAQHELPISATCKEPGKQCSSQVAQVQVTSGAWRVATTKSEVAFF